MSLIDHTSAGAEVTAEIAVGPSGIVSAALISNTGVISADLEARYGTTWLTVGAKLSTPGFDDLSGNLKGPVGLLTPGMLVRYNLTGAYTAARVVIHTD